MRSQKGDWIPAEWGSYEPQESDKGRYMVRGGYEIHRYDIKQILTDPQNVEVLNVYIRYLDFGWPYAGGWAEQRAAVFDIVDALTAEAKKKIGTP